MQGLALLSVSIGMVLIPDILHDRRSLGSMDELIVSLTKYMVCGTTRSCISNLRVRAHSHKADLTIQAHNPRTVRRQQLHQRRNDAKPLYGMDQHPQPSEPGTRLQGTTQHSLGGTASAFYRPIRHSLPPIRFWESATVTTAVGVVKWLDEFSNSVFLFGSC